MFIQFFKLNFMNFNQSNENNGYSNKKYIEIIFILRMNKIIKIL